MRRKDKKQDDRARMTQAMHRLEELLQNPGPGITVTPIVDTGARQNLHLGGDGDAMPAIEPETPAEPEDAAASATPAAAEPIAKSSPRPSKMTGAAEIGRAHV